MSEEPAKPAILHVDMDAFFVSCELRRRPELRGLPVVVGGTGNRGVVAAASYEARMHGVHSAMPSVRARRLCPQAVFLPGDHHLYGQVSREVMDVFRSYTPLVEPLSLDEAFLDVAGAERLHGTAVEIAHAIRAEVLERQQLRCSVGVARTKFLAKLGSQAAKPVPSPAGIEPGLGVKVIAADEEIAFLHPLPVEALWGVGPATRRRLDRLAVHTVGDLAALPEETVVAALGRANGRHLHQLAHAIDPRSVEPDQKLKSVGHEETFAADHHRRDTLRRELVRMADATAARLRDSGFAGRTVTLKIRFGDFRTITRSRTVPDAVASGAAIARVAKELLDGVDPAPGVRLLGVSVSGLVEGATRQLTLDDVSGSGASGTAAWDDATQAVDRIRARFGAGAVVPATLAGPDGIRVTRRGDQQWGPDDVADSARRNPR
ncbi:MAG: DNA polymerase IV [Acidimicrobiia bacterium]|nr:DNA polymerase IV [Acidimicrobiia bacterium]